MKKLGFKKLGFKKLGFKKLGIKKIGVIIGVILFSLGLFNRTEAYVMLPYQDIDYDYFELYLRYDTSTLTADSSSNDMLVFPHIGLDFSFKNIAYNMRILPYVIEDEASGIKDEVSWTIHNIHWQLFKDFDYGLFRLLKPGIQVGVTNIGLPKSALSEAQIFNAYLASYYLVSEFHMFNNPRLNLYWGINFNPEIDKNTNVYIVEYEYNKNALFVEKAGGQNYIGLKLHLSKYKYFEMAFNLSATNDNQYIGVSEPDQFFPAFSFTFHLRNPIKEKAEKREKVSPLKIDEWSYVQMEKGLIAFYDRDYKTALYHYSIVAKKYPIFALVHLRLGNVYYQLKEYSAAKRHWKKSLRYDISNPEEVVYFLKKLEAKALEIEEYKE